LLLILNRCGIVLDHGARKSDSLISTPAHGNSHHNGARTTDMRSVGTFGS